MSIPMKKLMMLLMIVVGILIGTGDCSGSAYNTIRSRAVEYANVTRNQTIKYSGITMDWAGKYAGITKNRTVKYVGLAKDNIVKYTVITKDEIVGIANSQELRDMLYLAARGATFGFVGNSEHVEDLIEKYPIAGRVVLISSRVIVTIVITKIVIYVVYHYIPWPGGVYHLVGPDGHPFYAGKTNNFVRRAAEHLAAGKKGKLIPVFRSPFSWEWFMKEQLEINRYGFIKNGGTLINKINAVMR